MVSDSDSEASDRDELEEEAEEEDVTNDWMDFAEVEEGEMVSDSDSEASDRDELEEEAEEDDGREEDVTNDWMDFAEVEEGGLGFNDVILSEEGLRFDGAMPPAVRGFEELDWPPEYMWNLVINNVPLKGGYDCVPPCGRLIRAQGGDQTCFPLAMASCLSLCLSRKFGISVEISPQPFIDFVEVCGDSEEVLPWITKNGFVSENDYPYVGDKKLNDFQRAEKQRFYDQIPKGNIYYVKDWRIIGRHDMEDELPRILLKHPVVASIRTSVSFDGWKPIYGPHFGGLPLGFPPRSSHAVVADRYNFTSENDMHHYLFQNSHGTRFGVNGFGEAAIGLFHRAIVPIFYDTLQDTKNPTMSHHSASGQISCKDMDHHSYGRELHERRFPWSKLSRDSTFRAMSRSSHPCRHKLYKCPLVQPQLSSNSITRATVSNDADFVMNFDGYTEEELKWYKEQVERSKGFGVTSTLGNRLCGGIDPENRDYEPAVDAAKFGTKKLQSPSVKIKK